MTNSNFSERTLLVADDHPIFRQGIKHILEKIDWIRVIVKAETGDSALMQIEYLYLDSRHLSLCSSSNALGKLLKEKIYHSIRIKNVQPTSEKNIDIIGNALQFIVGSRLWW